ncbi:MAG TPA: hypothetical protein VHU84_08075, partial [Lacipirellulaceae bacterium]|nr:hypothetical protein [Lacipirellulaceae bacterium]
RWTFLATLSSTLLVLSFLCHRWPFVTMPLFLIIFNVFAATVSINEFAIPLGMAAFRRDLDIRWYGIVPQILRLLFALFIHAATSIVAVVAALSPAFALLFLSFVPHCDLILKWVRNFHFVQRLTFAVAAFCGVFIPIEIAAVSIEANNLFLALIYWGISLVVSFLLTAYGR